MTVPFDWKSAHVRLLYSKRVSKQDPTHYRPISLLPIISKVMVTLASTSSFAIVITDFVRKDQLWTCSPISLSLGKRCGPLSPSSIQYPGAVCLFGLKPKPASVGFPSCTPFFSASADWLMIWYCDWVP